MLDNILSFFKDEDDGIVESGSVNSLSFEQVVKRYLQRPNDLLKILRIYRKLDITGLSKKIGFSDEQIRAFEEGEADVPYQFLCEIASLYNVDLKLLLCVFG
jgi:hypothetical protein